MRNGFTFNGFVRPVRNYFPMPNEWINLCAQIDNLAELKIIQYVLRHTWGFQEYGITKAITVEEFMHGRKRQDGSRIDKGTGLKSDRSVKDGLKAAIAHGYLISEVDETDLARIKKSYALKMQPPIPEESEGYNLPPTDELTSDSQVVSTPLAGSIYPSEGQHLPPYQVDTTPRSEKDTLEKHLEKDTLEKHEGTYGANAPTPAHPSLQQGAINETRDVVNEKIEEVKRITGEHPAVKPTDTESHYHIANGSAIGNEEEPVLAAPRLTLPAKQTPSQQAPGALTRVQAQPLSAPTPAQAEFPPAGSTEPAPTAQASGFTPPKRPTLKSDPREVQKRIDANRGYALEEKVEVIRERQAIKTWCSLHEIGECDLVLNYLTTQDKYWKLEENKHRIGGVTLAKETPKALAALERKGQPAQGPPQDWVPDENDYSTKAQLWRQEHMARSGK